MRKTAKQYTATDGKLVLNLESDGRWLVVTCPFDPELVTQAKTIDEAFAMAYDAKQLLDECRAEKAVANPPPSATAAKRALRSRRKLIEA